MHLASFSPGDPALHWEPGHAWEPPRLPPPHSETISVRAETSIYATVWPALPGVPVLYGGRVRDQHRVGDMCRAIAVSIRAVRAVVQDVLQHQAGRHQAHAVAVHQLQEIPSRMIDEGDARQINRACPLRVVPFGHAPAVFQLADPHPSEPPFKLQAECALSIMYGNLQHWFHLLSRHRNRTPGTQGMMCPW